jgi:hypothetical protein
MGRGGQTKELLTLAGSGETQDPCGGVRVAVGLLDIYISDFKKIRSKKVKK